MRVNKWNAIAAMSQNRVIGRGNQLPWCVPRDMAWFKETTCGQTLVLGRKTLESLQVLHPQNRYLVLTRDKSYIPVAPNVAAIHGLEQIPPVDQAGRAIWICGGGELYRATLARCQYLYLTVVKSMYEGDTFFPSFEKQFSLAEILHEDEAIFIRRYRNNRKTEDVY